MTSLRNALIAAAGIAAAMGISTNAHATLLPFGINPGQIGGGNTTITAGEMNYDTVATVTQTSPSTQMESGWAVLTGLANTSGGPILNTHGLDSSWLIYVQYTTTVSLASFSNGSLGPVTAFNYTMYADIGMDDTFNDASATPGTKIGTVSGNTGNDVELASGSLFGSSNQAGFNSTGGPVFSVMSTFNLTPDGAKVFVQPVPFYNFDFNASTSSSGNNIVCAPGKCGLNANQLAISSIINSSFVVPEPTSLALLGSSLVGLGGIGWLPRRKRQPKQQA